MRDMSRRRRKQQSQVVVDNGDSRMTSFLVTSGVISVVIIIFISMASDYKIGPAEGEIIPNIGGEVYENGEWSDFDLHSMFDRGWSEGEDSKWIYIQVLDTDCPYCYNEADEMSDRYDSYGTKADFLSVVVELSITGHESSKAEISAFKDKTNFGTDNPDDGDGCNSGRNNCASRDGGVHNWQYVDDLNGDSMGSWEVGGTPFHIILKPNGEVAWNQAQRDGQGIDEGLAILLGD